MTAVDDWMKNLASRNRSSETIRAYRGTIAAYEAVVGDVLAATPEDAERWWMTIEGASVKYRQRCLSAVRSFYVWADKYDLIVKDPTRRIDAPTQGQRLPTPVGRADLHTLLSGASGEMRRAICLGAYAGMRVSEVAALDWADIDVESRRIRVRGKGDKERSIGLPPLLLDELLPNTGGNVVKAGAVAYRGDTLQRTVNRYIASKGIEATFHNLRARFVTVALANGVPLLSVSRAVGHSSPSTTAIYALTADTDLDLIGEAVTR